jgi:hypothetical protein
MVKCWSNAGHMEATGIRGEGTVDEQRPGVQQACRVSAGETARRQHAVSVRRESDANPVKIGVNQVQIRCKSRESGETKYAKIRCKSGVNQV